MKCFFFFNTLPLKKNECRTLQRRTCKDYRRVRCVSVRTSSWAPRCAETPRGRGSVCSPYPGRRVPRTVSGEQGAPSEITVQRRAERTDRLSPSNMTGKPPFRNTCHVRSPLPHPLPVMLIPRATGAPGGRAEIGAGDERAELRRAGGLRAVCAGPCVASSRLGTLQDFRASPGVTHRRRTVFAYAPHRPQTAEVLWAPLPAAHGGP